MLARPGALEIFGRMSMMAPVEVVVAGVLREVVRKAERVDGNTDGRSEVMEVNVLCAC